MAVQSPKQVVSFQIFTASPINYMGRTRSQGVTTCGLPTFYSSDARMPRRLT